MKLKKVYKTLAVTIALSVTAPSGFTMDHNEKHTAHVHAAGLESGDAETSETTGLATAAETETAAQEPVSSEPATEPNTGASEPATEPATGSTEPATDSSGTEPGSEPATEPGTGSSEPTTEPGTSEPSTEVPPVVDPSTEPDTEVPPVINPDEPATERRRIFRRWWIRMNP